MVVVIVARELGVDISQVPSSGLGGRISVEDVKNYARSLISGLRGVWSRSSGCSDNTGFRKMGGHRTCADE
jgi:hypothetical protein